MSSNHPFVSIIIPTHNRRPMLARTLGALCAQTHPANRMELILVADGCTDDTVAFARDYTAPWNLHVIEHAGLGPSVARNRGAAQAVGDILIFLDDDMEVVPDLVSAHVRAQRSHLNTVAVGSLIPVRRPEGFFERSLHAWWEKKFFQMRQPGYRFRYDDLFGGNFSVRADFFARVQGFDPGLRCHEDYELGARLIEAGANFSLAMDAAARHHDTTDISRAFKRRVAEGQADIHLVQRHAGLHWQTPLAQGAFNILSRALRYLAFHRPTLGDMIARAGAHLLPFLEFMWLFGVWQVLLHRLQDYWYWRGVGTVTTPAAIQTMFSAARDSSASLPVVDLAPGINVAETYLDAHRPRSARFFVGAQWVGDVLDLPGVECLKGSHLHRILSTEHSAQLAVALAFSTLMPPLEDNEAWQMAWQLPAEPTAETEKENHISGSKKVVEIELSNGIPDVDITGYTGLHALIRVHGRPLGCVTLSDRKDPFVSSQALHSTIVQELGFAAVPFIWAPIPPDPETWIPITVVVCTRNRTAQLKECLQALFALDYPYYEILVVDNAPDNELTAQAVSGLPVRYIRETRPGLDFARNCGLREARHPVVAFTDDDAKPDRNWLKAIARALNDPDVAVVTGSVLPVQLDTPAQNLFEFGYGGMNHGFARRVIRRTACTDEELLWASAFGVGANMAFRKSLFSEVDGFDVSLDVGTRSGGGGDVEMFHRLVASGHTLVYEPSALVWHQHRPGMDHLKQLVRNNGRSFGCYLLTNARNRTVSPMSILHFALRHWLLGWIGKRLFALRSRNFPRSLVWHELSAALASLPNYMVSRARSKTLVRLGENGTMNHRAPDALREQQVENNLSNDRGEL